eukprot:jgi/Psemu1/20471/gm1.20471_g
MPSFAILALVVLSQSPSSAWAKKTTKTAAKYRVRPIQIARGSEFEAILAVVEVKDNNDNNNDNSDKNNDNKNDDNNDDNKTATAAMTTGLA